MITEIVCATASTLCACSSSPVAADPGLPPQRRAIQSTKSSTLAQRAAASFGDFLAFVQVLLVADLLQPAEQQRLRVFAAARLARALLQRRSPRGRTRAGRRSRAAAAHRRASRRTAPRTGSTSSAPANAPRRGERLVADAALGARHRAQERRVVVEVDDQAQPRAQVADLGAVEEALPARDLVRDAGLAQRLLEDARLVVGAVEDREVGQSAAPSGAAQRLDPRDRRARPRAPRRRIRRRRTGSPAPSSLHSFFSYSFGLWPITALAARRMLPVER